MDILGISLEGMNDAQSKLEKTAGQIARAPFEAPGDSVSLSDQMVSLLTAKNEFSANLAAARVADEMEKSTLNLLA